MTQTTKISTFFVDQVFVFSLKAFWFSKFYENEVKPDKRNFKRDFMVITEVKNS